MFVDHINTVFDLLKYYQTGAEEFCELCDEVHQSGESFFSEAYYMEDAIKAEGLLYLRGFIHCYKTGKYYSLGFDNTGRVLAFTLVDDQIEVHKLKMIRVV